MHRAGGLTASRLPLLLTTCWLLLLSSGLAVEGHSSPVLRYGSNATIVVERVPRVTTTDGPGGAWLYSFAGAHQPRLLVSDGATLTFLCAPSLGIDALLLKNSSGGVEAGPGEPGTSLVWTAGLRGESTRQLFYGSNTSLGLSNFVLVVADAELFELPFSVSSSTGSHRPHSDTSQLTCPVCPPSAFSADLLPGYRMAWKYERVSDHSLAVLQQDARDYARRQPLSPLFGRKPPLNRGSSPHSDTVLSRTVGEGGQWVMSFTLTASNILPGFRGFIGLGLQTTSMAQADLIACQLDDNGRPQVYDLWSESHDPRPDTHKGGSMDIFNVSAQSNADGSTTFSFSRLFDTGDPYDAVLPTPAEVAVDPARAAVKIIFSHGPSSNAGLVYHGAGNRAAGSVNFFVGSAVLGVADDSARVKLLHGVSMLLTWLLAYPAGSFTARYLKHFRYWLTVHSIAQSAGSVGCISFAVMAMVNNPNILSWGKHGVLGVLITGLLLLQLILGQFGRWRIGTASFANWHRPIAKLHKYGGFCLLTLGVFQVYLGIGLLWPGRPLPRQLYFAAIGVLLSVFTTAEVLRRRTAWQHSRRVSRLLESTSSEGAREGAAGRVHPARKMLDADQFAGLPELAWSDVNARLASGSKLMLISGIVVDVRSFLHSHPGGRSTLDDSVGTDATAAFLGVDPDAPLLHVHSALAWTKLAEMAVGVLATDNVKGRNEDAEGEDHDAASAAVRAGNGAAHPTSPRSDLSKHLAAQKARRLNELLHERRVVSQSITDDNAHLRRYRVHAVERIANTAYRLLLEQTPGHHPRPFLFPQPLYEALEENTLHEQSPAPAPSITSALAADSKQQQQQHHKLHAGVSSAGRAGSTILASSDDDNPNAPEISLSRLHKMPLSTINGSARSALSERPAIRYRSHGSHPPQYPPQPPQSPHKQRGSILERTYIGLSHLLLGNTRTRSVPWAASRPPPSPSAGTQRGSARRAARVVPIPQSNAAGYESDKGYDSAGEEGKGTSGATCIQLRQRGASTSLHASARVGEDGWSRPHYLHAGEHIALQCMVDGEAVERYYTPVPYAEDPSLLQVLFKVYPKGAMTPWLKMRVKDDYVKARGPFGRPLLSQWACDAPLREQAPVLMIAGGTGVTPFVAFVHELLAINARSATASTASDGTRRPIQGNTIKMLLLVFDRTPGDALLVGELDELVRVSRGCLTVLRSFGDRVDQAVIAGEAETTVSPRGPRPVSNFCGRISTDIVLQCIKQLIGQPQSSAANVVSNLTGVQAEEPDVERAEACRRGLSSPSRQLQHQQSQDTDATTIPGAVEPIAGAPSSLPTSAKAGTSGGQAAAAPLLSSPHQRTTSATATAVGFPPCHQQQQRSFDFAPGASATERSAVPVAASASTVPTSPSSSGSLAGPLSSIQSLPRVFVCGPIDFLRATLAVLDELKYDMKRVECL